MLVIGFLIGLLLGVCLGVSFACMHFWDRYLPPSKTDHEGE